MTEQDSILLRHDLGSLAVSGGRDAPVLRTTGQMVEQQLENTRPRLAIENPFSVQFNTLPLDSTRQDETRRDTTTTTGGTTGQTTDSTTPQVRPGNIPHVRLSEGTDVFLPDVNNWNELERSLSLIDPNRNRPGRPTTPGDTTVQPTQPQDTLPSNVSVNSETRKIDKIEYPGGKKVREFKHDARGLSGVTQRDESGVREYVKKEDNKWYMKVGNMHYPLAGEFDLDDKGNFKLRNSPNDPWQVEAPDGKLSIERPQVAMPANDIVPGAARRPQAELTKDKHGNVETVKLPNGSTRTFKFDESGRQLLQITDRVKTANGEQVEEWTRQALPTGGFGDKFTRTQPPGSGELRSNVRQLDTGAYQFTDARGETRTSALAMQGDGQPKTPWKADMKMDDKGRFKSIENDKFKREYEYFEGTNKIKSYHVVEKATGRSATWSRASADSYDWQARDGEGRTSTMKGEFAITDDGVHVIQKLSDSQGNGAENYAFLGNGTRVSIKATEGNGLVAAEGGTTRYVRRGDGSTVSYVGNDNNQISVYDGQTKQRTTWTKGADGLWKSDSPYEPEARKDLKFNDKGELSYVDDKGNTRTRTLAGEEIIGKKDGSKLVFDNQGRLSKVIFGDIERTFQKDSRGNVTSVLETNSKGESRTVFPPPLTQGQKVEDAKLTDSGDLQYTIKGTDGSIVKKVTDRSNGIKLEHDKDNMLTRASKPNGVTRTFEYVGEGALKTLVAVKDTRATSAGERSAVWARQALPQGGFSEEFHSPGENGKEKTPRKIGNVLPDGDYEYTTKDSKPGDKPRVQTLAGGDGSGFSGSVEESRINLMEAMERNLDAPRLKRVEEMMKAFEQRMTDRATARKLAAVTGAEQIDDDVSKTVSRTYDTLAQMVSNDDPNTFFDKNQRAFLAENFLFHAQDPSTMDQGSASNNDWDGHGTCWIQAAHIWGMTQRTDHMADLLKQVSLTGSYTTKNSGTKGDQPRTVQFSKNYLKFPQGYQESNWCISKATDMWDRQPGLIRQCDGDRSPVGKIFDYVLPVLGGRSQNARAMDGGTHESFTTTGNRWYTGNAEIMQMVTGDKPCDVKMGDHGKGTLINGDMRKTLLEKGTVLNYSPGHMKSIHLKQIDNQWVLIQDNQHGENDDRIIARISNLEAWARGDRSAERQVNERVPQRKYRLENDSTIGGMIKPTPDTNEYDTNGPSNNNNRGRRYSYYR